MKSVVTRLKHLAIAAGAAGAVAFLQTLSVDGAQVFGTEPWWPVAAAAITLGVAELEKLEADE